jgi:hypothetical protein
VMTIDEYLSKTLGLMNSYHIPVRSTFDPACNYDDFFTNGKIDGPRRISIDFVETDGYATVGGKRYTYSCIGVGWLRYQNARTVAARGTD